MMSAYANGEYAAQLLRLNSLVLNVLTQPMESGRQDLGDLISVAASFRARGERENDPIMAQASRIAYNAASATFRKYRAELINKELNERGFVEDASGIIPIYIFCEHRVSEYESLGALEDAAKKQLQEIDKAWKDLARELSRQQ